jgi:hypothetical protein
MNRVNESAQPRNENGLIAPQFSCPVPSHREIDTSAFDNDEPDSAPGPFGIIIDQFIGYAAILVREVGRHREHDYPVAYFCFSDPSPTEKIKKRKNHNNPPLLFFEADIKRKSAIYEK